MTLGELAAIADILAALAIVATLIYIAVQTRQANRNQRNEAIRTALQDWVSLIASLTESDEVAEPFRRFLLDFHALSMDERGRISARLQRLIGGYNQLRLLYEAGLLPQEEFDAFRNITVSVLRSAGGRAWFEVMSARYPAGIRDHLRAAIDDPAITVPPYQEWFPALYGNDSGGRA